MSRSVDLFIDTDLGLDGLADRIAVATNLTLQAGDEDGTWMVVDDGIRAELRTHPYLDDGELLLSKYRFVLSCQVPSDRRLLDAPETEFLRMASEALRRSGLATILVHDLQFRDQAGRDGSAIAVTDRPTDDRRPPAVPPASSTPAQGVPTPGGDQ